MGHMAVSHIERQRINNPSLVDITGYVFAIPLKPHGFLTSETMTGAKWS
jgi:hypothetical protein